MIEEWFKKSYYKLSLKVSVKVLLYLFVLVVSVDVVSSGSIFSENYEVQEQGEKKKELEEEEKNELKEKNKVDEYVYTHRSDMALNNSIKLLFADPNKKLVSTGSSLITEPPEFA